MVHHFEFSGNVRGTGESVTGVHLDQIETGDSTFISCIEVDG